MLKIFKSIIFNLSTKKYKNFYEKFFSPRLIFSYGHFSQGSFFTRCHFFYAHHCTRYTLLSIIGIYMVLIIIIVCSKLCSMCIHQRIKLYANIIIRDNFTALLFGTIFFSMVIVELLNKDQDNRNLFFNFWDLFMILTLLQLKSQIINYLINFIL